MKASPKAPRAAATEGTPKAAPTLREHLAAKAAAIRRMAREELEAAEERAKALEQDVERIAASASAHLLDAPAHEFRDLFHLVTMHAHDAQAPDPDKG